MGAYIRRSRIRAKECQENTRAFSASVDAGAGRTAPCKIHKNGCVVRPWTAEEDAVLREHLVCQIGTHIGAIKPNWSFIQRHMQWRTVEQMRARWRRIEHCYLPNRQRMGGPAKGHVCNRCGVPRAGHACPFSKPKIVDQAEGRLGSVASNAKVVVVVAKAEPMPALDDFVVWKPVSHEEIGEIGDFPWTVTELG